MVAPDELLRTDFPRNNPVTEFA